MSGHQGSWHWSQKSPEENESEETESEARTWPANDIVIMTGAAPVPSEERSKQTEIVHTAAFDLNIIEESLGESR